MTLRVSASDAAGGSISETIVRGYGVSSDPGRRNRTDPAATVKRRGEQGR